MVFGILDICVLGFTAVSLVVYMAFLFILVRHRKKEPFSTAFFTYCLSQGVADLTMWLHHEIIMKFRAWRWFGVGAFLLRHRTGFVPRYCVTSLWYFGNVQMFGVINIAVNRFTTLTFPTKTLWTGNVVRAMVALQWLLPMVVVAPMFGTSFSILLNNETDSILLNFDDLHYRNRYYAFFGIFHGIIINVAVALMYAISFCKVWRHRRVMRRHMSVVSQATANNALVHNSELKLAVSGLLLFITICLYATFMLLSTTAESSRDKYALNRYTQLGFVANDLACLLNPWLILCCSEAARNQFASLFNWPTNDTQRFRTPTVIIHKASDRDQEAQERFL